MTKKDGVSQKKLNKIYLIIWNLQRHPSEPITKKQVREVIEKISKLPKSIFPKSHYAIERLISRAFNILVDLGWIVKVKQRGVRYSIQSVKLWKPKKEKIQKYRKSGSL